MKSEISEIINTNIQEVLKSPELTISLFRIYSRLYLDGKPCRMCARSQRNYYAQLKKNGFEMAEIYESKKNSIHELKFKGNRYIAKMGTHVNTNLIDDKRAIEMLKKGFLLESDFITLPANYPTDEISIVEDNTDNKPIDGNTPNYSKKRRKK